MSGLVTFYRNQIDALSGGDKRCQALKTYFSKEVFDETAGFSLLEEVSHFKIESPQDFLFCMRNLLSVLIFNHLAPSQNPTFFKQTQAVFRKTVEQGFWKEFQLGTAFIQLAAHLLGEPKQKIEIKQLVKGATLLEAGVHVLDGQVPHPFFGAELALVWVYLGWIGEDEELLMAGVKSAHFLMNLCDKQGTPFHSLWLRENAFHPLALYSVYALLFGVASKFHHSSKFHVLKEALLEKLEKLSKDAFKRFDLLHPLFALLFELMLKQKKVPKIEENFSLLEMDQSLGFLRYDYEELSLACTASGVNTGLGALHKGNLEVVSFGPHFNPLADSDRYGVYRTCTGLQDGFKDLVLERQEESCRFKGWSRLISPFAPLVQNQNFSCAYPGDHWVYFDIQSEKKQTTFDIAFSEYDESHPLSFVFFVRADKACIKGLQPLLPGSLNRFQGASAQIIFEKEEEKLTLYPKLDSEMLVIPLAGRHHFWSADFLIAFPIKERLKHYTWTVF